MVVGGGGDSPRYGIEFGKLEVCHYCVGGEMDGWHDVEDMVLSWGFSLKKWIEEF